MWKLQVLCKILYKRVFKYFLIPLDYFIFIICNPPYWIEVGTQNKEVTTFIYDMVRNFDYKASNVTIGEFTTTINGVLFWTSNYPYGYGGLRVNTEQIPSRYARLCLYRFIEKYKKNNIVNSPIKKQRETYKKNLEQAQEKYFEENYL